MNIKQLLKILTWNADSLLQNIDELVVFLRKDNIKHSCLISETKETRVKIREYWAYHAYHPSDRVRGISSLFIKDCFEHSMSTMIELDAMQISTVRVKNKHSQYNIASIYCPPRCKLEKNDFISLFDSLGPNFIIGGDFNSKHNFWSSKYNSPKGRRLYQAGMQFGVDFFSTGKPKYWPTDTAKTPDLVDFFIAKGLAKNFTNVENSSFVNKRKSNEKRRSA